MVSVLYLLSTFFPALSKPCFGLDKMNVHVQITNVHIFLVKVNQNKNERTKRNKTNKNLHANAFYFFRLSEDEGSRVKGRRITLSDINGNSLNWKPFNGTWISGKRGKMSVVRFKWRALT